MYDEVQKDPIRDRFTVLYVSRTPEIPSPYTSQRAKGLETQRPSVRENWVATKCPTGGSWVGRGVWEGKNISIYTIRRILSGLPCGRLAQTWMQSSPTNPISELSDLCNCGGQEKRGDGLSEILCHHQISFLCALERFAFSLARKISDSLKEGIS